MSVDPLLPVPLGEPLTHDAVPLAVHVQLIDEKSLLKRSVTLIGGTAEGPLALTVIV